MARMDEASQLRTATNKGVREGMEKGLKKGLEKGLKQGRKEGRKEGIEEGREEGKRLAAIEAAKKFKEAGVDIATICACTGLPEETVLGL